MDAEFDLLILHGALHKMRCFQIFLTIYVMAFALYILQQASVGSKTRSGVRSAFFTGSTNLLNRSGSEDKFRGCFFMSL